VALSNFLARLATQVAPALPVGPVPAPVAVPAARYQWAPDYSSVIDTTLYPGAVYMEASYGGGSEGAAPTPAGWYYPGGYDSSGTEGAYYAPRWAGAPQVDYWFLKAAGLWNLTDPDSATWRYLQAQAGNAGDVKTDAGALFKALSGAGLTGAATSRSDAGRAQIEAAIREALAGLNPQFVDAFSRAVGDAVAGYWTASKQAEGQGFVKDLGDVGRQFRDFFTQTPLGVALIAATGGAILAGSGGTAGAGVAEAGAGAGVAEGAAVSESFLGPATGTVLEPGLQASGAFVTPIGTAGLPVVSGIAVGAGAFMPQLGAPVLEGAGAESFVGPPTGTVLEPGLQASGAVVTPVGEAGLPVVSGVATGAGAFLPPALAQLGGAELLEKGLAALKAAGAKLVQQALSPARGAAPVAGAQPAPVAAASLGGGDPVTVLLLAGLAVLALMR
jgi:hypothetical protein